MSTHVDSSCPDGMVEQAKQLGVSSIPVGDVLDELAALRSKFDALHIALSTAPRAESISADFDGLTWTFQIEPDCKVSSGWYALVRLSDAYGRAA